MDWATWRPSKFVRFLATGLVNTIFGYLVFATLICLGVSEFLAVPMAMVVGTLFNFLSYGKFVFKCLGLRNMPKFALVYLLIYAFNVVGLRGLGRVGMGPYAGQAILALPLATLAYALNDRWVFRAN